MKKVKVFGVITLNVCKTIEVNDNENPYNKALASFSGLTVNSDGSITTADTNNETLEINTDAQADFFDYDIIE